MKKILVIMASFAPNNTSGSIPNTKIIKYLSRLDTDITLITDAITPDMVIDEKLVPKEMDRIRVLYVKHSTLYHCIIGKSRKKATDNGIKLKLKAEHRPIRMWFVSYIKRVFFAIRSFDWRHNAKQVIRKELKGETFDIVYSSYPVYEDHQVAKYIINSKKARKWVADFRDPMSYFIFDKYRYTSTLRKQHRIERKADHITVVSKGAMDKFRFPDIPEEKLTYIPNGYDPEDYHVNVSSTDSTGGKLRLFYAGTLYFGHRDLTVLFRAISELAEEGLIDPDYISLEYAGNEWPILQGFAERYHLLHICTNYGYITRHRVMELLNEIDCSLVCSNNTALDHGVVTGKVFELLLVNKPIIAVISGDLSNSELGAIVKDCGAGVVYEEATADTDYPRLKQWLLDIYREKNATGRIENKQNEEHKLQYSYENIAKRLCSLFDDVLS